MLKKLFFITLCVLAGGVFLFSAFAKLDPIEPFEYTFTDLGLLNWHVAPFAARILIGLELFAGLLLALNLELRTIGYRIATWMLIFFSIYLAIILLVSGNHGNCGCFGSVIVMTPLQALIKNIILLAMLFFLKKKYEGWKIGRWRNYAIFLIFAGSVALPFVANSVDMDYSSSYLNKPSENYPLELDTLYVNTLVNEPPHDLATGKHVICFFSVSCKYCRMAATKAAIMHRRNPSIPFYFVFKGKKELLDDFRKETGSTDIPYCLIRGRAFTYLAGVSYPQIYLVNNGTVEHTLDLNSMDQQNIEIWLNK